MEQNTQWSNGAKLCVGLLKELVCKDMKVEHTLLILWDYFAEKCAMILSLNARDLFQLQGSNPYTVTFVTEEEISNFVGQ